MKITYKAEGGVEIFFEDDDSDSQVGIMLSAIKFAKNVIWEFSKGR